MGPFQNSTKSLRTRFAIGFGILFTFFFALALVVIYVSFGEFRKDEFYERLKNKALTTFKLLVEVEQIDKDLLKVIDKNTLSSLYDEKVLIFKDSTLIYSSIDDLKIAYVPELFAKAKKEGEYLTTQGEDELVALYIEQGLNRYVILASAFDTYGRSKMTFLKWVMITVYFAGLIFGWIVTYFFVKNVIKPLEVLKAKLTGISYNNLDARLPERGQGEEVNSLSVNFNQMLTRLEQSVSFQRDFIHYASHELRTPLAAMVGLTENSLNSDKTQQEYKEVLQKLYREQKNLTNVTNSLLLLSDSKSISNGQEYPKIRLDELIFKSVEITKNLFPKAKIEVNLEGDFSNENLLLIHANEPLMLMAFNNLLKNAIQYSFRNLVTVVVRITGKDKQIEFSNPGGRVIDEEKEKIFTPFYRGSNAATVKGYGLGLPFVRQIVQLHAASINYTYQENINVFTIAFPSNPVQVHTAPVPPG